MPLNFEFVAQSVTGGREPIIKKKKKNYNVCCFLDVTPHFDTLASKNFFWKLSLSFLENTSYNVVQKRGPQSDSQIQYFNWDNLLPTSPNLIPISMFFHFPDVTEAPKILYREEVKQRNKN